MSCILLLHPDPATCPVCKTTLDAAPARCDVQPDDVLLCTRCLAALRPDGVFVWEPFAAHVEPMRFVALTDDEILALSPNTRNSLAKSQRSILICRRNAPADILPDA